MTDQITVLDNNAYLQIVTETDVSALIAKLKQLCAIKDVMQRMNTFHANAVRYARLEAAALIRIIELGGINKLSGPTLGVARWLSTLSQDQISHYVSMCEEGLTIYQVWKREYKNKELAEKSLAYVQRSADKTLSRFKESGIINLSDLSDDARSHLDEQTANDIIDGVRRRIRKAGGIGVGDGSTEYILPTHAPSKAQISAVKTRIFGILNDLRRLLEICDSCDICVSATEVGLDPNSEDTFSASVFSLFETLSVIRR